MQTALRTEEEAKQLPCPFFRYCVNEVGVIQDRDPVIYVHQQCMASACIAWRSTITGGGYGGREVGWCGIAGRPE